MTQELLKETADPSSGSARPSMLAVTSELPWPLSTGGHLRSFHLMRALAQRFRLRLVTAVLPEQLSDAEVLRQHGIELHPALVGPRRIWRESLRALAAAGLGEPYVCYRRQDRWPVRGVLRKQLAAEPPDVFYLDHLDSLVFRGLAPRIPCVIDMHNAYSTLVRRVGEEQTGFLKRVYLRREARLLEKMEHRAAQEATALLSVSPLERDYFASLGAKAAVLVPNGVDCSAFASLPLDRLGPPILLYVGAMSWRPNAQAAMFLAEEVLPGVRRTIPDALLKIVGRDPPRELLALRNLPGVEVTGGVPDVVPYFAEAQLLAVPLDSGGGTRLKILEAFAAGLPVVSTAIGCEGIDASHGEHLLVADCSRFAEAIVQLLQDQPLRLRLAAQARELARARYDWQTIGAAACEAAAATCRSPR